MHTQFYRIKGGGGLKNFVKSIFAHIFAKFEYFAKVIIYSESPDHVL